MTLFRDQGLLLGKVDIGGRVHTVATECGCRLLVPASTDELRLYPCDAHKAAFAVGKKTDMYGHEIVTLGDTGFGVSTSPRGDTPMWTFFHASDDFRQALFGVTPWPGDVDHPEIWNVFRDRMSEVYDQLMSSGQRN